jgi:hypothetical protein
MVGSSRNSGKASAFLQTGGFQVNTNNDVRKVSENQRRLRLSLQRFEKHNEMIITNLISTANLLADINDSLNLERGNLFDDFELSYKEEPHAASELNSGQIGLQKTEAAFETRPDATEDRLSEVQVDVDTIQALADEPRASLEKIFLTKRDSQWILLAIRE